MYDIVGIYTDAGDLTAKYTYDSWGNVTSISDGNGNAITSATHVGNLNPFRYRGYYMDTETGFYYVSSRYYDPIVHRFVSADNADVVSETINEFTNKNLFVYCDNNPVIREDRGGEFWNFIAGAVIGAFSVYVGDVIQNISEGKSGWDILKPTSSVGTYLGAAVSGAIPGSGIASALIRSTVNTTVAVATDYTLTNQKPEISKVIGSFTLNIIGEGVSAGINKVYDVVSPRNYSSFRHQITRRIPHITQQQTKHAMSAFLKSLIAAKKALGFTVNVITSRDY